MTPTEKLKRCKQIWREATEHKAKGERLVLELMRHPDTTPEQLQDCRRVMLNIEGLLKQSVTGLRKAYPSTGYLIRHPWWADEYNRYEVRDGH
jgi:hypothetical protein